MSRKIAAQLQEFRRTSAATDRAQAAALAVRLAGASGGSGAVQRRPAWSSCALWSSAIWA